MSDCIGAPAREWLERYVEGTLPEPEAQRFEEHYFDCARCLAELQAVQEAQEQLRRHPVSASSRRRVLSWPVMASFAAMAAALVMGYITVRTFRHAEPADKSAAVQSGAANSGAGQPAQQVAQLADLHLPPYRASTLRGDNTDVAFERGMKLYAAGDCTGASKTLAKVDPKGPDGLAAQFYAGACRMQEGDSAGATSLFHRVASAGDSPQQESAWYYLAQIALMRSDVEEARQDLGRVVALHGDLESQARKQLDQLPQAGQK
jgi:thioredoxin-like negative regulator of GroEL